MTASKKMAEEIVAVLKYNADLSNDMKVLAVETRIMKLIQDVEKSCEEASKRAKESVIPISDYSDILPREMLHLKSNPN